MSSQIKNKLIKFYNKYIKKKSVIMYPESKLAHKYLDGLEGIEIGGSAHNPFGLNTLNVDRFRSMDTQFKKEEEELCGKKLPVDIVSPGDDLPLDNKSTDFIISSHVIEHFFDPIKALNEWGRVARKYIFMVIPHKERTFDKDRPLTSVQELIDRHEGKIPFDDGYDHFSVWNTESFLKLCDLLNYNVIEYQDTDDKVGNGFTIVIQLD